MKRRYLSVTEVNNYIFRLIKSDPIIQSIYVKGEISNCKRSQKGYIFFSLKDDTSKIDCVIFDDSNLESNLKDGMLVEIMGNVDFYQKDGNLKIKVYHVKDVGIGIAFQRYAELALKLKEEGLLEQYHKKPLNIFPERIGIITSSTGSVLQDIINVRNNRHPQCELLVYPTTVQGGGTSEKVEKGIIYFNKINVDTIIIARGGGSYEDLIEFNNESLARQAFLSKVPIISAIGHETDTTILDLVADCRASTPSMAAEIALPSNVELLNEINLRLDNITFLIKKKVNDGLNELRDKKQLVDAYSPRKSFTIKVNHLRYSFEKIQNMVEGNLRESNLNLDNVGNSLALLNPLLPFEKGFSIVKKGSILITKGHCLEEGDEITLEFIDKKVMAKIL